MDNKNITAFQELLSIPRRIAITMHQKPDGDAIGSALGLYHYLTLKGHRAEIVSPTDYPENLKFLPGTDKVLIGPEDSDRASWIFDGADIIFCLDFNALHRINEFEAVVKDSMATKVMIDHHMDPDDFADLAYWDDSASSTAELIYRLIEDLGDQDLVNEEMGTSLYTGILTDTGSFRFTNTSPKVHRIIARLLEAGVLHHEIHEEIYSNSSVDRLKFIGHALSNCLHVLPELKTAYIKLDKTVFKNFNLRPGDTEGLVNYALGIRDVNLGVLLSTQDDIVKLSFRSRGKVSSNYLAGYFNGGGHFYAAGGKTTESLDEVETKFIALLEANKEMLTEQL